VRCIRCRPVYYGHIKIDFGPWLSQPIQAYPRARSALSGRGTAFVADKFVAGTVEDFTGIGSDQESVALQTNREA
jgi:hypothetical protein